MSAFVCSPETIGVVAKHLVQRFQGDMNIDVSDFAEKMAKVNLESVAYRYQTTPAKACKDFTGQNQKEYIAECRQVAEGWIEEISEAQLWGCVSCWIYQSCESDACVDSPTYTIVKLFDTVLEDSCTQKGTERVGWGL